MATAVALAGAGYGVANAADERPAVALVAASANAVGTRYVRDNGQAFVSLDLGVHAIAGDQPLEIWAKRSSYAEAIKAERFVTGENGERQAVALPEGLIKDFEGLTDFTEVTIADAAGATVKQFSTSFCPNAWDSARTRRDAPADNPFPSGCAGGNPFLLGAVWGIQAGWNAEVRTTPRFDKRGDVDFDIAPGQYKATVKLTPAYRELLDVPESAASVTVNLTITDRPDEDGKGREVAQQRMLAASGTQAEAVEHVEHGTEGDAAAQVSAYHPEFRPPAKRPATLAAEPKKGPRPDLRSLPAHGIELAKEDDGKWYVSFGATVWNGGNSPLRVDGFRRTGTELMDAYQYFFDANGKEVGSVEAGTMEWDPQEGHNHWHFTDFAQYNLLNADKSQAVRSGKEAFCLVNTDAVDYTLPNAKWRPENTDLYSSCGANTAVAVREVLDVGSGDTYTQNLPGQSFEVTDLPNGTYFVEVLANPDNKLAELNTKNNSALRKIILGGTAEKRTLRVPPLHGIKG
ncbi:lysyl oxidase family protein [Jidongwangia harbinensis]|uniref:lysyl oxidase family protein n=1 Tax=Jidongwangia harbinensis TaxID=2878561 RepID=UPI001CD92278|nr:lysyl oxidase family protein [Jidongwangia harbinensis]MCA2215675.1 hypothetical protein [Jidongwangia harbinensis]